jgi:hypothetical protein
MPPGPVFSSKIANPYSRLERILTQAGEGVDSAIAQANRTGEMDLRCRAAFRIAGLGSLPKAVVVAL